MGGDNFTFGQDRFEILTEDEFVLAFRDISSAVQFLSRFRNDDAQMRTLRSILVTHVPGVHRMTTDQILNTMAQLLVNRRVSILQRSRKSMLRKAMDAEEAALAAAATSAPPMATQKVWVEFRVVDDETGKPIEGIELTIKLPDGRIEKQKTNAGGYVEINDTVEGECEVSSDFTDAKLSTSYAFVRVGDR